MPKVLINMKKSSAVTHVNSTPCPQLIPKQLLIRLRYNNVYSLTFSSDLNGNKDSKSKNGKKQIPIVL